MHARGVDLDSLGVQVDHEIAGLNDRLRMSFGAAHDCMNTSYQFVLVERLGHVIVGAETQSSDLVFDAGQTRWNQNRRLDLRNPQTAKYFEAGHVRKIEIEQDNVVVVDLAEIDPFFPKVSRIDVEALGLEHQLDRLRCCAVVFDQQYAHANPSLRRMG